MLIELSTLEACAVRQVGGKAASLIRLLQAGVRVPGGVVLTAEFFAPWIAAICASEEWRHASGILADVNDVNLSAAAAACEALKLRGDRLSLSTEQEAALGQAAELSGPFAVRSSSPEEDLAGASYAGLYETVLGAQAGDLEVAVRTCFKSSLDLRVLLEKDKREKDKREQHNQKDQHQNDRQQGSVGHLTPSLAVIVQTLVPSDVAGVAFSINPLTNDYDEVLVNASWGLGEALVTGDITPDRAIYVKPSKSILEKAVGDKGGDRAEEFCLSDEQVREVGERTTLIEELYGAPMDVEWAYAQGDLYVVQARPITTYTPLHPSLITQADEPRRLYMDGYLTDGVTMSVATTPMADDMFATVVSLMWCWMTGADPASRHGIDFAKGGLHMDTGRFYIDLSMWLHLANSRMATLKADGMNPMMLSILQSDALDRYRPEKPPRIARAWSLFRHIPRMLWHSRAAMWTVLDPMFRAKRFDATYASNLAEFDEWIRRPIGPTETLEVSFVEDLIAAGRVTLSTTYPAFVHLFTKADRIKRLVDQNVPEQVALADAVCGGYEQDMIVDMGRMLFDMSRTIPRDRWHDLHELENDLKERRLPAEFYTLYERFIHAYGNRGPLEMEIANDKYGDSPMLVLQQLKNLSLAEGSFDPHAMHAQRIRRREDAYAELLRTLSPRKAKKLQRAYHASLKYSDAREYFKHHMLQCYARARKLLLNRADTFVREGRLNRQEQIFDLTIAEVDEATKDPSFDVRDAAAKRSWFSHQLRSQVQHFPMCIDSRGRVLRPQMQIEDGALVGSGISPGVARGPIKILSHPFEKELHPGDVLVAVTTDPGWTPLFINVSAVILEVGGELQHGALIAREYGKPCVSSIPDVVNQFEDGQIVEVDGSAGVIRIIE